MASITIRKPVIPPKPACVFARPAMGGPWRRKPGPSSKPGLLRNRRAGRTWRNPTNRPPGRNREFHLSQNAKVPANTHVLSETLRPSPSAAVVSWLAPEEPEQIFLTTVSQTELLYGRELFSAGQRCSRLLAVIEKVLSEEFEPRLLPQEAAHAFATMVRARELRGRPISQSDATIAATAQTRRAAVATRNVEEFEHCGIRIVNPWDA